MKIKILVVVSGCLLYSCTNYAQEGQEPMNLLPMYGGKIKSKAHQEADAAFIEEAEKQFRNRQTAAKEYVERGWQYFYQADLQTAMKRFNQAWLLDSLNAEVYWGMGNILGQQLRFQESIPLFQKSLHLNDQNAKAWLSAATSYLQLSFQTKDAASLKEGIHCLEQSVTLDATNAQAYAQLAAAYFYAGNTEKAKVNLKKADQLDASTVNPELRRLLRKS